MRQTGHFATEREQQLTQMFVGIVASGIIERGAVYILQGLSNANLNTEVVDVALSQVVVECTEDKIIAAVQRLCLQLLPHLIADVESYMLQYLLTHLAESRKRGQ